MGVVPEVHVRGARAGTEVPGRGQDMQHARKKYVRHIVVEDVKSEDGSKSGEENESSNEFGEEYGNEFGNNFDNKSNNEFGDKNGDKSEGSSEGLDNRAGDRSKGAGHDKASNFKTKTNGTGDLHQDGNRKATRARARGATRTRRAAPGPRNRIRGTPLR